MGTRADFYIGTGTDAIWLGSIGMDGMPEMVGPLLSSVLDQCQGTCEESCWKEAVALVFAAHEEHTLPERGWPWPWNDSIAAS